MTRVALPPGIYNIRNGVNGPFVTNPADEGEQLFTADAGPAPALNQQFLIDGSGRVTAIDNARNAAVALPAAVNAAVTSAANGPIWIVNVALNPAGTWTGTIQANDTNRRFWGTDANNVRIQANVFNWTFVRVAPP